MLNIAFTLNGQARKLSVATSDVLADVLRDRFGLAGCKVGCDQGVCGACTVLVDEAPMSACTTFAFRMEGKSITTIEGLGGEIKLHPVQAAFLEQGAFQCGFCTSGMILSAIALLAQHPQADEDEIRTWLSGNICRCTGYGAILSAVKTAQMQMQLQSAEAVG